MRDYFQLSLWVPYNDNTSNYHHFFDASNHNDQRRPQGLETASRRLSLPTLTSQVKTGGEKKSKRQKEAPKPEKAREMWRKVIVPMHKRTKRREYGSNTNIRIKNGEKEEEKCKLRNVRWMTLRVLFIGRVLWSGISLGYVHTVVVVVVVVV